MLTDSQFWTYLHAQQELEEIERVYHAERQEAYEGIAPTITGFDYGSGRIYKLACHVEDYASYLVELYEKRNQRMDKVKSVLKYWKKQFLFSMMMSERSMRLGMQILLTYTPMY